MLAISLLFLLVVYGDRNKIEQIFLQAIDKSFYTRSNYGEIRYVTLARIEKRVYVLVYTLRNTVIRLISARKANTKEVKRYDNR